MGSLENKRVIVTGGSKGIGQAIVLKFLKEGAFVTSTYNSSKNEAFSFMDSLGPEKEKLWFKQMDITDPEQVSVRIKEIIKQMDGVDILVNNAGIIRDSLFYKMKPEDWDIVIKTNLYGPFYACKSVLLSMYVKGSGGIINVASTAGLTGVAGQSNYCASKFGLIGLTKSLAKELASKNIRVNAVAPGFIETDMINKETARKQLENNTHTLLRLGKPFEVADAVAFLAGDESAYITGQVMVLDGGVF